MKKENGFSLLELIIVIAIIGILTSIAIPQYTAYTKRAKFTEVVAATNARKTAVTMCYHETNSFGTCNGTGLAADYDGIPRNLSSPGTGYTASASTASGVITAVGNTEVDGKSIILTPSTTAQGIIWAKTGTCIDAGFC